MRGCLRVHFGVPPAADIAAAVFPRAPARGRGVRGIGSGTRPGVHAKDISVEPGAASAVNAASRSRARVDGTPDPRFRPRGLSLDAPGPVPGRVPGWGNSSARRGGARDATPWRNHLSLGDSLSIPSTSLRPMEHFTQSTLAEIRTLFAGGSSPASFAASGLGMWPGGCTFSIATRVTRRASYVRILTETGVF